MSKVKVLVTGAAGRVGGVGRTLVELLHQRGFPLRALVRRDDERAEALRGLGVEVVVGDLTRPDDVLRAFSGCRRVYFGMSVSEHLVDATVLAAAVGLDQGDLEVLVNMSQMSVSQMTLRRMTGSPQHQQHFLAEQVLNWSGLPVVHLRPTIFLEHPFFSDWAAESIGKDNTLRLPFGAGRTSPVAASDVAAVAATVLANPATHVGKIYELTGPRSQDMHGMAAECSEALHRTISFVDVPLEQWEAELRARGLPEHLVRHFIIMARTHATNAYDRRTDEVERLTGKPALSVRDYVLRRPELFGAPASVR